MNAQPQTMAQIARTVAERHDVTLEDLSRSNRRSLAHHRQEAMWEMWQVRRWTTTQIGRYFHGLNHSTVSQGVRAHETRTYGTPPRHRRAPGEPLQRPARIARPKGARIVEIHGTQDGIRFGVVALDTKQRGFFHDRLNGTVRLYRGEDKGGRRYEDRSPDLVAMAKAVLDARWADERRLAAAPEQ